MFYIDPVYFWYVFIPVLVISLGVQLYMRSTYNKWGKVRNSATGVGQDEFYVRTASKARQGDGADRRRQQ